MDEKAKSVNELLDYIASNYDDNQMKKIILTLNSYIDDDQITDNILLSLLKKYKSDYCSDLSKLDNLAISSAIEVLNLYK